MDKVTEHLIEGCRRGDRSSQLKLYKQYAQRLYIACLRIVGNSSEAEEAMQDSFLKIFTRLDQYHDGQCFEADTVLKKCVSSKVLIFVVNKKINKEQ